MKGIINYCILFSGIVLSGCAGFGDKDILLPTEDANNPWSNHIVDGREIKNIIDSNKIFQSSYESDEDYVERTKHLNGKIFESYGYVNSLDFDYDANTEQLISLNKYMPYGSVLLPGYRTSSKDNKRNTLYGVQLEREKSVDVDRYIGTNVFGAQAMVSVVESNEYYLILGEKTNEFQQHNLDVSGACYISKSEMRKESKDIIIQYMFRLKPPYMNMASNDRKATLKYSQEVRGMKYYFYADLLSARLINKITKKEYPCSLKIEEKAPRYWI